MSNIVVQLEGRVARIALNRIEKRNAIDDAMRVELTELLRRFADDHSVRVVTVTGNGTAFCAGVDLGVGAPFDPNRPRLVEPFDRFPKPLIAAINGPAIGGGFEIALACDIRLASKTAGFSLPEVKLGSLPGSGGTQRLPIAIGSSLAAQMIFSGEPITADRALSSGLVSEICESEDLQDRSLQIATIIAQNAPLSVVAAKKAIRRCIESSMVEGYVLERKLFNELAVTEDRQEGRLAFRERRLPVFKGK